MKDLLALEAINYATPVPRNRAALTAMGLIFDRVYFPGVYLPSGGFDVPEYKKELERLRTLDVRSYEDATLISIFAFLQHRETLKDLCVFTGTRSDVFGSNQGATHDFIRGIQDAIHGPPPPNFIPHVGGGHHKGLPGSEEFVSFPDAYGYLAGAVLEASRTGIPILSDEPSLPVPGLRDEAPKGEATLLAGLLAITCTAMVLPEVKPMSPEALVEFRVENAAPLRRFRRAMLKHAAELDRTMTNEMSAAEATRTAEFYVHTQIMPELDEMVDLMNRSSRSFGERLSDVTTFVVDLGAGLISADPRAAVAIALAKHAPGFFVREAAAKVAAKSHRERSELYYLLKLRGLGR